MSIYQTAKDDIALALTASTGLTITAAHFNIIATRVATSQESIRNTKAHIVFTAAAPVRGESNVYYDRLDLTGLMKLHNPNVPVNVKVDTGLSVYTILTQIRDEYGAVFTSDDLVETFSYFEGALCKIQLKAKSTSLGWLGEDIISFSSPPLVSTAFTTEILPEF